MSLKLVCDLMHIGVITHHDQIPIVADVMRVDIPEIPPDIPAIVAAQIMLDQGVREMYLMHHDGGIRWPAAALRFKDVLQCLAEMNEKFSA